MRNDYLNDLFIKCKYFFVGLAVATIIYLLSKVGLSQSYATFAIAFICFSSLYFWRKNKYIEQLPYLVLGITLIILFNIIYKLYLSYQSIPIWDFMCFYLFGKAGVSGANFYDPHVFSNIFNQLNSYVHINQGFIKEIVNVGFWYPAPSMFLFLPLGILPLQTGHIIWQSVLILFLVLDIVFLLKMYHVSTPNEEKIRRIPWIFLLSLILLFPSLVGSIQIAQTVPIFVFLMLLAIKNKDNWKCGVLLALMVIIKPLAVLFALYLFIGKNWKGVLSFVFVGLALAGISLISFGFDTFFTFFKSPPTGRIPIEVFYETTNQSLHAVILRLQLKIFGIINFKTANVITYLLSFLILGISVYSSLMSKNRLVAFLLFIPMALLIYPNTLGSYLIITIPLILLFYRYRLFKKDGMNLILLFALFGIAHVSFFFLNLVLWCLYISITLLPHYSVFEKSKLTSILTKNETFSPNVYEL